MDSRGPRTADLADVVRDLQGLPLLQVAWAPMHVDLVVGRQSLWAVVGDDSDDSQEFALRLAFCPGGCRDVDATVGTDGALAITLTSDLGAHRVTLRQPGAEARMVHAEHEVRTEEAVLVPYLPRDLYPLGEGRDPDRAKGEVKAAQRGVNGGLLFLERENRSRLLYIQDLTRLNDFFVQTGTVPDGSVGGEWPELGFLAPTALGRNLPAEAALPPHQPFVLGSAVIAFEPAVAAAGNDGNSLSFIRLLASCMEALERPPRKFRDWPTRAQRTIVDIQSDVEGRVLHRYGERTFIRPYLADREPDSMCEASMLAAVVAFDQWQHSTSGLASELRDGMRDFFDPSLGMLRRFLPDVDESVQPDVTDSWYHYHPLLNLGLLALDGDTEAERLFRDSLDRAVEIAHNCDYTWPVQFNVRDLSVVTGDRDGEEVGETDVTGFYAFVMLLAAEITGDRAFIEEAEAAIEASRGYGFDLNYQANLTAWGAAACMRLHRWTGEAGYLNRCYGFLASLLHNSIIWESRIGAAEHYGTFLAVTCLHDAEYVAAYEVFDTVRALDNLVRDCTPEVDDAARHLIAELCAYAVDRAWYAYPDALPAEIVSDSPRNGEIDRGLSFPLEDLYASGQQAGQVGQEIYGAGAGLHFAARTMHRLDGAPFTLYSDYLVRDLELTSERSAQFVLEGGAAGHALVALVPTASDEPIGARLTGRGTPLQPVHFDSGRAEFAVPSGPVMLEW